MGNTAGSDFSSPPSGEEVAIRHEKVFGKGSADVLGSDDPNWREKATQDAEIEEAEAYTEEELAEVEVEPEFTEDQKERFLEATLSDSPFKESIELFGGRMRVTFRTRSEPESREILKVASEAGEGGFLTLFQAELSRLHMAFALVSIESKGEIREYDEGTLEERLKRIQFGYSRYRILEEEMRKFDALVEFFSRKATSPDFWQTADGS